MRTRSGLSYLESAPMTDREKRLIKRRRDAEAGQHIDCRKRRRFAPEVAGGFEFIAALPDELVLCILCKLVSTASCPEDFINVLITCKRLNGLALNRLVLSKACADMLSIKAKNWCESAHKFLKLFVDAGNAEACFILGMIHFYCFNNWRSGASLMAKAAINSHAQAVYSLSVIQFNGSGGEKSDKDLRAGVALCARSASLGSVDALRELGHCLQDGYGVKQDINEGRRFLIQANARELAGILATPPSRCKTWDPMTQDPPVGCPLFEDLRCAVPLPEIHPANRFLAEWYSERKPELGLRLCSHSGCGRSETRRHEFRRCSVCGKVHYCSRACQALDWKLRHKPQCFPPPNGWPVAGEQNGENVGNEENGDGAANNDNENNVAMEENGDDAANDDNENDVVVEDG